MIELHASYLKHLPIFIWSIIHILFCIRETKTKFLVAILPPVPASKSWNLSSRFVLYSMIENVPNLSINRELFCWLDMYILNCRCQTGCILWSAGLWMLFNNITYNRDTVWNRGQMWHTWDDFTWYWITAYQVSWSPININKVQKKIIWSFFAEWSFHKWIPCTLPFVQEC